jgi:hypothetical protein
MRRAVIRIWLAITLATWALLALFIYAGLKEVLP